MKPPAGAATNARPRSRTVFRMALVLVPLVALFAVFGILAFRRGPRNVGQPAPSFDLQRLDAAGRISSDDFRGRAYVLNFWASWCIPCREEAPMLARVAGDGSREPAFIGVNILDGRDDARAFLEKFRIRYPNGRDVRAVTRAFAVTGIPETIFVDGRGRIAGRYIGALDERTLRRLLAELVELDAGETLRITGRGRSVGVP